MPTPTVGITPYKKEKTNKSKHLNIYKRISLIVKDNGLKQFLLTWLGFLLLEVINNVLNLIRV